MGTHVAQGTDSLAPNGSSNTATYSQHLWLHLSWQGWQAGITELWSPPWPRGPVTHWWPEQQKGERTVRALGRWTLLPQTSAFAQAAWTEGESGSGLGQVWRVCRWLQVPARTEARMQAFQLREPLPACSALLSSNLSPQLHPWVV